jgi:putative ABC transport system permease protein
VTCIQLSYGDLVLPARLVVMDGHLSLVLRLKLEKQLGVAQCKWCFSSFSLDTC